MKKKKNEKKNQKKKFNQNNLFHSYNQFELIGWVLHSNQLPEFVTHQSLFGPGVEMGSGEVLNIYENKRRK